MTNQEKILVQNSWRMLRDIDPQKLGDLFYSKLFFDHPEVRPLFPKEMTGQMFKLIHILNIIVARLDHFEDLSEEITALAKRHVDYGVQTKHYAWVGAALLWTLERSLVSDWTPPVEQAWKACYALLSGTMLDAV